jgi:outer membrane lipoprotein-sorting protein
MSAFKKREMRMDLEEDEEEEVPKPKAAATKTGGSKKLHKEGKVYKKKMKTIFTQWDERYLVLEGEKLMFYSDSSKKTLIRTLSLKTEVTSVFFHYDENAPKVSKRIAIKEKDESRFDLYVTKPMPRAFMLRVDNENVWEAEDWINTIQDAIK